jgi:hypothetical protein
MILPSGKGSELSLVSPHSKRVPSPRNPRSCLPVTLPAEQLEIELQTVRIWLAMTADLHFWLNLVPRAARATLLDVGSQRLGFLLIEVLCAVVAWHAYRAPQGKRWAAVRAQWTSELGAVFVVFFSVGVAIFGYQLVWNQPNQRRLPQAENLASDPSALFHRTSTAFPLGATGGVPGFGRRPICVQVMLPQDFEGGSYQLPFKPVPPSPPTLYDNGSAQRRGVDYTVSGSTIVVKNRPKSKDSLSVWYTTDDRFAALWP